MSERPASDQPEHDVYTILLIVATALTIGATAYLVIRSQQLFGSWNPFAGA
ncbi:MAG: hypothetical protein AABZ12_01260 [Planctomycetota bacterium]